MKGLRLYPTSELISQIASVSQMLAEDMRTWFREGLYNFWLTLSKQLDLHVCSVPLSLQVPWGHAEWLRWTLCPQWVCILTKWNSKLRKRQTCKESYQQTCPLPWRKTLPLLFWTANKSALCLPKLFIVQTSLKRQSRAKVGNPSSQNIHRNTKPIENHPSTRGCNNVSLFPPTISLSLSLHFFQTENQMILVFNFATYIPSFHTPPYILLHIHLV